MAVHVVAEIVEQGVTKRTHNKIMKKINRAAMIHHRDKRLALHYQENAKTRPGGEYGFRERSKKYNRRKMRKKGHTKPNVYSGYMQRYIRNNSRITATRNRGRFYSRNYFKMKVEARQEIEVVARSEHVEIAKEQNERYTTEANKPSNQRKRRRKVS